MTVWSGKIVGLSLLLKIVAKATSLIAKILASDGANKLKPSERAALLAAATALDLLLAERPIPGVDDNPGTIA